MGTFVLDADCNDNYYDTVTNDQANYGFQNSNFGRWFEDTILG